MATKGNARFTKLLVRGITGLEAGRFMVQEGIARRGGQSILTDDELNAIKERVKNGKDLKDFNRLVDIGIAIDNLTLLAQNNLLEICLRVSAADNLLISWWDEVRFKTILSGNPRIVTAKQFQELKAAHKEKMLSAFYSLEQVTSWRARELSLEAFKNKEPETLKAQQPNLYRQLWQQARGQIRKLMRAGKLEATYFESEFKKKTVQGLKNKLKEQNLSEEEWSVLLQEKVFFTGETLYRSGLPEWPRWIDGQEHLDDEGSQTNYQVAVIQALRPDQVDERGYYTEENRLTCFQRLEPESFKDEELFRQILDTVRAGVRHFRALETVIEDATETLCVNFSENIRERRGHLVEDLKRFNGHLEAIKNLDPRQMVMLLSASSVKLDLRGIDPINLDQAMPDPKTLKAARAIIAASSFGVLGEDWWEGKRPGHGLGGRRGEC